MYDEHATKEDRLKLLGQRVTRRFEEYETNRRPTELRWMQNLRQYLGKYDPEIEKNIPAGRSRVYPRDTFVKVVGFVSKMMELLFPANEKNWGVAPSPVPNLRKDVVNQIIRELNDRAMQAEESVTGAQIEEAIFAYAEDRARAMERECSDQLVEMRYVLLAMRVIRSGAIYGIGVSKGPLVTSQEERIWEFDQDTGHYGARSLDRAKPYFDYVQVWNIYPDLDAKDWSTQEGLFERMVFSKNELYEMLDDDSYMEDVLRAFLKDNPRGNYIRRSFEGELDQMKGTGAAGARMSRMYEVIRWYGFWPSQDLKDLDTTLLSEDIDEFKDVLCEVWLIGGNVFRVNKAVLDTHPSEFYHAFIYREDDEVSMVGNGLPESIRDSQLSHCAIRRMIIDNAAQSAGPLYEVNTDLLEPADRGNASQIHAFKVFRRRGLGAEAQFPAIREVSTQSHISELLQLSDNIQIRMDIESNMPAWMFGNPTALGEAFRTSTNMSMMMGGATMGMKAIVRGYDMFTESMIGSLVRWNTEFNERDEIKGDFEIVTRGSTSLVAKELRGMALDQFISTLSEEEKQLLKTREVLIDRLQARDLPVDRVVDIDQAEQILAQIRQQSAQASQAVAETEGAKAAKLAADTAFVQAKTEALGGELAIKGADAETRRQDGDTRRLQAVDKSELESIDRALQMGGLGR